MSWNEQCKPNSLPEFDVVHKHVVDRLKYLGPFSESIIFCGPPGSGKSTLANCLINHWMTNVNGSKKCALFKVTPDNIGQWINFVSKFSKNSDYIAIILFDGVWSLPEQDQQYLASVIETNRVCVFITTSVVSGWSTCLRSQLLEIEMDLVEHDESYQLAKNVLSKMNQKLNDSILAKVVTKSRGNIFWLIHGLQAACLGCTPEKHGDDHIREKSHHIIKCIEERDWPGCRSACIQLWESGWSSNEVIHYLYEDIASSNFSNQLITKLTEKLASMTVVAWGAMGVVKPMDSFVSLIGKVATLYEGVVDTH